MSLDDNKLNTLGDKLNYLYKNELLEQKCVVNNIDIDFNTMENLDGQVILEEVWIHIDFEYEGQVGGYESENFITDLDGVFKKVRDVITKYTPTPEGKIKLNNDNVYVSYPSIYKMTYEFEELHTFSLTFDISYPQQ